MKESLLQSKIVIDFSQKRPEEKGLIWATGNRTLSERDGMKQKAMGLIAGVSDLIYFKNGIFIGIEIKVKGSKHKKSHVQQQLNWGLKIEENGGEWYIVTSLESFWAVINGVLNEDVLTSKDVKMLIDDGGGVVAF